MARPPRIVVPSIPHHVTQRGNYRQKVFYRDADRELYLQMLQEYSRHYGVSVQAYCLMSNHVHLIATPHNLRGLSRLLQRLHSEYARALHIRLRQVGHLWQARYASVPLDQQHFWQAMVYVERNPVRAGLAAEPWAWSWSSARAHVAGLDAGWLDLVEWRKHHDGESWKRCLELGLTDASMLARIRDATRYGWPLGSEEFLDAIERQHGIRARRSRPGPPPARRSPSSAIASGDSASVAAG